MTALTLGRRRTAPPYPIPVGAPYNVPATTTIPTPDGTGAGVHPDVVDFGGTPWRGYRFWMAFTPYHNNDARQENPCIVASRNGLTWHTPEGLTNPTHPAPVNPSQWNSDTELAYDPTADQLILMWRNGSFVPCVARSSDGVTWTPATASPVTWTTVGEEVVSPSIVRLDDGSWAMWGISHPSRTLYRWSAPAAEGPWVNPTVCSGFGANVWHLNVVRAGGGYRMIMHEGWDAASGGSTAYAASSPDGLSWTRAGTPILSPDGTGWDGAELYRSALQHHENGTHMRVWYSGRPSGAVKDWRIGLTLVPLAEWPSLNRP